MHFPTNYGIFDDCFGFHHRAEFQIPNAAKYRINPQSSFGSFMNTKDTKVAFLGLRKFTQKTKKVALFFVHVVFE